MRREHREEILSKIESYIGTEALDNELEKLPDAQQEYVISMFGLDGAPAADARTIADVYGVSAGAVRERADAALIKLSHPGVLKRLRGEEE